MTVGQLREGVGEALDGLRRHERESFAEVIIARRLVPAAWHDAVRRLAADPGTDPYPDLPRPVGFRRDRWFAPADEVDGGHSER